MKKVAIICSVVMLGALTALAGTISVPQFNDGGGDTTDAAFFPPSNSATFISLHNNTSVAQEYTIVYFSGTGAPRTPANNTFSIAGNASLGWRPVATDTNEGAGNGVPNASGAGGNGSATILYTDTIDPSGRVFVTVALSQSSYGFALFPAQ